MTQTIDIETALAQLTHSEHGFGRLRVMTGAHTFINHGDAVSFKVKGSKAASFVKITLEADDTYTMLFGKIRKYELIKKQEFAGVYAENLKSIFESTTGLYLSL